MHVDSNTSTVQLYLASRSTHFTVTNKRDTPTSLADQPLNDNKERRISWGCTIAGVPFIPEKLSELLSSRLTNKIVISNQHCQCWQKSEERFAKTATDYFWLTGPSPSGAVGRQKKGRTRCTHKHTGHHEDPCRRFSVLAGFDCVVADVDGSDASETSSP